MLHATSGECPPIRKERGPGPQPHLLRGRFARQSERLRGHRPDEATPSKFGASDTSNEGLHIASLLQGYKFFVNGVLTIAHWRMSRLIRYHHEASSDFDWVLHRICTGRFREISSRACWTEV